MLLFLLLRSGSFMVLDGSSSPSHGGVGPSDRQSDVAAFGFLLLRLCFREGQGYLWWEGGLCRR